MSFILVLLGGGFGFYTVAKYNDPAGSKASNGISYPSYLPGKGVFVLTCIGRSQTFTNFAYQVKMRFISGDCGGITFRNQDPDYDPRMYIFYICQNGYYALKRYSKNLSDPGFNPVLKEGYSHL